MVFLLTRLLSVGWMLASVHATLSDSVPLKTFKVYHALTGTNTDGSFISRGEISLSSSDSSPDIVASASHDDKAGDYLLTLEGSYLQTSFYQIKVVDPDTQRSVMTSVPACHMRRSNLREEITLILGESGSLLSVSLNPLISPLAPPCAAIKAVSDSVGFQSVVSLSTAQSSMTVPLLLPSVRPPSGYSWFPRTSIGAKPNPVVDEQQTQGTQQSFFRKYWYIILPIMITTLLGSPEEEPTRQQGQQTKSSGSPASGAPTSASSQSARISHPSQRQRRGKRG